MRTRLLEIRRRRFESEESQEPEKENRMEMRRERERSSQPENEKKPGAEETRRHITGKISEMKRDGERDIQRERERETHLCLNVIRPLMISIRKSGFRMTMFRSSSESSRCSIAPIECRYSEAERRRSGPTPQLWSGESERVRGEMCEHKRGILSQKKREQEIDCEEPKPHTC